MTKDDKDGGTGPAGSGDGASGTATRSGTKRSTEKIDEQARELGEKSASFLERLGVDRAAGGLILIVIGLLVLVFPALLKWTVGVGAILLGVLVLGLAPDRTDDPAE